MHLTAQMQYGEKLYQKMNLLTAFGPLESIKVQNKFYLLHCFQPSMEHQLIFQSCDVIGVQGQNLFYPQLVYAVANTHKIVNNLIIKSIT